MRPLESLAAIAGDRTPRAFFAADRERQGGFELIFAEARRRESNNAIEATQSTRAEREQPRARRASEPTQRTDTTQESPRNEGYDDHTQTAVRNDETAPANETEQTYYKQTDEADAAPVQAPADTSYDNPMLLLVPDEEILNTIAEILHISPEALLAMLKQLDMQPQDLTNPKAVTALLQEAFNAETPVALLSEPAFPAAYKAINEAMAQMAKPAETATVQIAAPTTSTATAKAAPNTVQIPVVEGLQYATENGQLVVTDKPATEQAEAQATPRPTASAPTATATQGEAPPQALDATLFATPDDAPPPDPTLTVTQPLTQMIADRTQAVQITQQAQHAQYVNPADVINQIMSQIRVHTGEQVTEMRLTLRPESLGDIVLRVLTQNGIVTAQFIAENQRVREALESSFNQLRDALQERGIEFSELSVSVRQDGNEWENQFEQGRQSTRNRAENINAALEEEIAEIENIDFESTTINLTA
ncbi:MAG: flagellar hook-length control protein FliK [Defluviitaleaceae bacterium]|nr:flagellar hook-length control protein FliK [Defluviitaleaceae bacterium]MCL2240439.1 flagellar hook-length control protein FliK [Defluviitaleaceae bacterium]